MPNYRRADVKGGTYFFTVVTFRRQTFLCDEPVRTALRQAIERTRQEHPFTIEAMVLLPDHLHCIWTLPPDDAAFGLRWSMIKRFVTQHCAAALHRPEWLTASMRQRKEATLWQRRFWEHLLRDEQDYARHVDYIHYNPVKHGWAQAVAEWPWSTFHRYVQQGVYEKGWAGTSNSEAEEDFGEIE
uniref:REP-associated tyrosine transposase n=1 Tax=Candidatus Electronema sp. TaxID=2698783 RepID=UPI00405617D1